MIAQNSFTSGINQDIAKTKMPNTGYLDALNMRLLTDIGSSSGVLQNIEGNTFNFTFPNTFRVYEFTVNLVGPYFGGTITIAGQTSAGTFTPSANTTGQDLYDFIANDANLVLFGSAYNIAVGTNNIVIFSSTQDTSPSFAGSGITTTVLVSGKQNLIPIGFTTIRNDVYLFTTSNTSANPGGHDPNLPVDPQSDGQIWKLTYNEEFKTFSYELKYNGLLDFTTQRPIATTACLGVYENVNIQRLYWTDFFNQLRSVNIVDPNLMAINPNYININPPIKYSIPILKSINLGGSLDVGAYQCAYMLKNNSGALTNYSDLSNLVFIVSEDESTFTGGSNFKNYVGANAGTSTSKSITWKIEDLDLNFDTIELVVFKRDSLTGNIVIMKVAEEPIPSSGTFEFTYTGNEDITQIDLNVFNTLSSSFTHCKTIKQKDNRLFAGNIRNQYSDIDFDARAYRFNNLTNADLIENGVTNTYNIGTISTIDEESDAINPDQSVFKYQSDGSTLGGEGTNIKYEFGLLAVKADSTLNVAASSTGSDYRHTNPDYSFTEFDLGVDRINNTDPQVYNKGLINSDVKAAYYNSLLKGYQPGETYRFAIQFFDKNYNPKFAKWIADIKMPELGDTINPSLALYENGTASPVTTFIPSFVASNEAYVNQLFVNFEVTISQALSKIISGYKIVRLDRTDNDKTILGTGILNQVYDDGGSLFLPDYQAIDNGGCETAYTFMNMDANPTRGTGSLQERRYMLECPEFLLGGFPGYVSGDQIRVMSRIEANYGGTTYINGVGDPYIMTKFYENDLVIDNLNAGNQYNIDQAGWADFGASYGFSAGYTFNNYTRTETNTSDSVGPKTLCVELDSSLGHSTTYGILRTDAKKLLVQYYRPRTNQYGGNTYSQRSRNEYISCSHFRPIQELTAASITDNFKVFGGDVFTQIYDHQKLIKNWGQTGRSSFSGGLCATVDKVSHTFFFPCYATHNTGLRHGNYINRNLIADDGSGASGYESHEYNLVYSCNNDIKKYRPKPTNFILNEEFDNRIHYSEVKINGELSDSWGIFRANNFYDLDGMHGKITALEELNDNLFSLQERAVAFLSINPISQVLDDSGTAVVLGKGDVIQDHKYLALNIGTRHQHSVIKSSRGIYFIDTYNRKLYSIKGSGVEDLTELKGLESWFNKNLKGKVLTSDNPIYMINDTNDYRAGISCGLDSRFNEVIFTIHDKYTYLDDGDEIDVIRSSTVCYNELMETFTSFYSYKPYIYIYDNRFLATMNPNKYNNNTVTQQQELWVHNANSLYGTFYNTPFDSYVKMVVNPNPNQHKIFDNLLFQTEVATILNEVVTDTGSGPTPVHETFNSMRIYNDYQDTGTINLTSTNLKRRHRYWKTFIPNDTTNSHYSSFKPRMRDYYAIVQLNFTNNNGKKLVFHNLFTEFRFAGTPLTN